MKCDECAVRFSDLDWETPRDQFRHKVRKIGSQRIRLVEMLQGMEHPDWCTAGHVGYVLEGTLAIEMADGTTELCAGDGLILPPGEAGRHRPTAISDRVVMALFETVE